MRLAMRVAAVAVAALAWMAGRPALANPEQIYTLIRPGGFVEVGVVDRQQVRAVELVAPGGQSLKPLQTTNAYVVPVYGPNGWYFDVPDYSYNPFRGEYGSDPRCNPEISSLLFCREPAIGSPPRDARSRSVARFLVGDTGVFRQTLPQWRLRIAYADAPPLELSVPPIAFGY
jgi:hypothetical protein